MKILKTCLLLIGIIILSSMVLATNCWEYDQDQTSCQSADECTWRQDPWGSWCEQKGCWNFFTQSSCQNSNNDSSSNFINKSCSWNSNQQGWCEQVDCYTFDGTDQTTCENNTQGVQCSWVDTYNVSTFDFPCIS